MSAKEKIAEAKRVRVKAAGCNGNSYVRMGEPRTPTDFETHEYNINLSLLSNPPSIEERDRLLDKVNRYEIEYM